MSQEMRQKLYAIIYCLKNFVVMAATQWSSFQVAKTGSTNEKYDGQDM